MIYGYVSDNTFPLLVTYAVGDVLNIGFLAVYYRYSTRRAYVFKVMLVAFLCNAILTIYAVLGKRHITHQPEHNLKQIVGFVAIASSLMLYASPFSAISRVVKTKSSSSIPIVMCIVGVVNNALWVLYGALIDDMMLIIPTSISIVLGCIQIVLYFVYRPSHRHNAAAGSVQNADRELTTTTASSPGKHGIPFSIVITPTGGGGFVSSAPVHGEDIELTKITLESPRLEQTRPPLPPP
uniref:Bidirectional sugar transporter SWEET n=1 Tax=Globisporangium ultimum (strain ATCC 200006 / CBS 805.95 / DAOM BR144) TaxID=431595 RepID=K3WZZ3_GLOUD